MLKSRKLLHQCLKVALWHVAELNVGSSTRREAAFRIVRSTEEFRFKLKADDLLTTIGESFF